MFCERQQNLLGGSRSQTFFSEVFWLLPVCSLLPRLLQLVNQPYRPLSSPPALSPLAGRPGPQRCNLILDSNAAKNIGRFSDFVYNGQIATNSGRLNVRVRWLVLVSAFNTYFSFFALVPHLLKSLVKVVLIY